MGELRHELADIRWARRASFHLTLKFLGEVDEALIPALQGRLQQAAAASGAFEIAVEGLGTFGDRKRPRVVWAGIHERTGALDALQAGVEGAADSEGIEAEARPFRPHLTLARLKRSHPGLGRALAPRSSISLGSSRVSGFTLMQSRLEPGGTLYTPLHRFRFREPAGGGAA